MTTLTQTCARCGVAALPGAAFCSSCGTPLQAAAAVPPPPMGPPVVPGQRPAPPGWPAPPGPPQGYVSWDVAPTGWGPAAVPATDGLGVASLVLSLVWLAGLGSVAAIVLGHVSRHRAKAQGRPGSGLALAGLIIGYVGVALPLALVLVVSIVSFGAQRDLGYQSSMKSDLKSASIAEESFATDNDGHYTMSLSDLTEQGFLGSPANTTLVIDAQDSGYCLETTSIHTSAIWYLSSDDDIPTTLPCS